MPIARFSTIDFLVNEYKLDPDTFFYESSYDTTEKKSLFTKLYIDLENYLSSKHSLVVCYYKISIVS